MLDTPADAAAHNQATGISFWTRISLLTCARFCSMLSVLSRGMLLQSDQARACWMRLRTPLLTTKQPDSFLGPDMAADNAPGLLHAFGALARNVISVRPGARMLDIAADDADHNQATVPIFGPGYRC